ncbi:hypothetical protein [Cellulophaga baltica]|uniref:hypothetical protein n=1 Tax=Cellulophaga baltica TaxID=76594 RepID=UPI000535B546|nr:hypothetical protein [Cellulophaga baltica]AIY11792.1 hypothetical protein M667_00345 [Cellulophaga baltica NN016038]
MKNFKKSKLLMLSFTAFCALSLVNCEETAENAIPQEEQALEIEIPSKLITTAKAINDYNNFYDTRIKNTNETSKKEIRNIWFSTEELNTYFQKLETISSSKNITITKIAFIFGANEAGERTIFIAPMTLDENKVHRAFSLDNDEITFLHDNLMDKHMELKNPESFTSLKQSLILSSAGYLSSLEAINQYNNYYDHKLIALKEVIEYDTRICYYEKGVFENYLNYLNLKSEANTTKINGVNVVFSVYDDTSEYGIYANHQTIFFAPTTDMDTDNLSSKNSITSFNSVYSLDFNNDSFETKNFNSTQKEDEDSLILNKNNMGPPPYDTID